jgi:alkylation response protein AidB-like acyl-CoA dehydrogenase
MPNVEALEHQQEGLGPALFRKAAKLGLMAIEIDPDYGGLGLDKVTGIGVWEQLTRLGGFGVTAAAHSGIGMQPLIYFGTEAQKQKYLPKLASGEWIAAYALSETGSGSDALGMRSKATLTSEGNHYVLNGTKMWISNAGWADLITVFAKVDGKLVTAFLVERAFPGVSTGKEEHKLGIKSSSTRRVILEDVKVPVENVLGEIGKGGYIAFNILNLGRFGLGAGCIGAAKDLLRVATQYALERQQFARPIASFGLIQHKLAEMAVQTFAGESATYRTAAMIDAVMATGEMMDSPAFARGLDEFAIECSIIKILCSEILQKFGDKLIEEQEVLAWLSDIISDIYLAESACLRTLKVRKANARQSVMGDLTLVFVNDSVGRMEAWAKQALSATSEGEELRAQLGIAKRLLRWQPLNTVAMRRGIAQRLCEVGSYPALIAEK